MGSLNINGGRDRGKLAVVSEFLNINRVNVVFYKKLIAMMKMKLSGIDGGKEIWY